MLRKPRPLAFTSALLLTLVLGTSFSCQSDDSRGLKRGAATGALVGLTMGALTGDAGLAAKGAAMGAVAGGAAGSMQDLTNERENERTQITADAIAGRSGSAPLPETSRPATWSRLNDFVGSWNCAIWGLDNEGNKVTANAQWTGLLATTSSLRMKLVSFDAVEFNDQFDDQLSGYCQISYEPGTGHELIAVFTTTPEDQRWVGERLSGDERYSFYYVGSSRTGVLGTPRSDKRLELRFIGRDVFIIETFIPAEGGGEKKIQSYRFTRSS